MVQGFQHESQSSLKWTRIHQHCDKDSRHGPCEAPCAKVSIQESGEFSNFENTKLRPKAQVFVKFQLLWTSKQV